jgi:hypothetical protein
LFLVAFVLSLLVSAPVVTAAPRAVPVDPDDYTLPPHALVGTWLAGSGDGATTFIFEPDGSFTLDYELVLPSQYQNVAYLSPAAGTWMPAGEMAASFRAEQGITHARGTFLGTVTIEGTMALAAIGGAAFDNEITGTVTMRDASGHLISVTSLGGAQPALTATRAVAASPDPLAVLAGDIYDVAPAAASEALEAPSAPGVPAVLAGDIYDLSDFGGGALEP